VINLNLQNTEQC